MRHATRRISSTAAPICDLLRDMFVELSFTELRGGTAASQRHRIRLHPIIPLYGVEPYKVDRHTVSVCATSEP